MRNLFLNSTITATILRQIFQFTKVHSADFVLQFNVSTGKGGKDRFFLSFFLFFRLSGRADVT